MSQERPTTTERALRHDPLEAALARGDVETKELDGIPYLTYPGLDALPGIRALTTMREGATHKPHNYPDEWLERFVPWLQRALGVPNAAFVAGRQVHGDARAVIGPSNAPRPNGVRRFDETDALVTTMPAVGLIVLTADCLPVFLADSIGPAVAARGRGLRDEASGFVQAARSAAVAIIHAGKAGTHAQIARTVSSAFLGTTPATPATATALIGPSIGDGCYPVPLWDENVRQLRQAGVERIITPALCTRCNLDHFYSYRAEKGCTGRMVSAIILAEA